MPNKLKRPCSECPWVVSETFRFDGPEEVRGFMRAALRGSFHQCHLNTRQWCVCKGARLFAARALGQPDASLDQSVRVYSPTSLLETAYRLQRAARLRQSDNNPRLS